MPEPYLATKPCPVRALAAMIVLPLLLPTSPAAAQDEVINDVRDQLSRNVSNSAIGAGYAQMLNFFVEPDISASVLESAGTDYDVFKLPLQFERELADSDWRLALRATLSHARASTELELGAPFESVATKWEADSGQVGAGLIMPLAPHWTALVAAEFGISRLENTARYRGELGQALLPAVADGIIFNWDTNARVSSLTGAVGYASRLADKYDFSARSRYTFSHIASYSESRDLPSFSEDAGTVSLKADLKHPFGLALGGMPLFGKLHAGGTAFTGANRDELGFSHFYELGYSVGIDISHYGYRVRALSLGYQVNAGRDVDGYSVLFAWELR
ncbi:hypothetical protein [Seongchinamella sediminis]|nr:hypothetical protein [Seongchinamella sediminis]